MNTLVLGGNTISIRKFGIDADDLYDALPPFKRILRNICFCLRINTKRWMKDLSQVIPSHSTIILFDFPTMLDNCAMVEKYADKTARLILYFWNPLFIYDYKIINRISNRWEKWTFDPEDALNYNIKYGGQFIYDNLIPNEKSITIESDLFFIGQNKGRFEYLKKLELTLTNKYNIRTNFVYVDIVKSFFFKKYKKPIPYSKMLSIAQRSKAILEINQSKQSGLTLRALEALLLGKKLVTNNDCVLNYRFSKNLDILILDDNTDNIGAFLERPNKIINPTVLEPYRFLNWMKRMEDGKESNDYNARIKR